jgi:hypothetical protein
MLTLDCLSVVHDTRVAILLVLLATAPLPALLVVTHQGKAGALDVGSQPLRCQNLRQRRQQHIRLLFRANRDAQKLVNARVFEVAHDDGAFAQGGGQLGGVVLRVAGKHKVGGGLVASLPSNIWNSVIVSLFVK